MYLLLQCILLILGFAMLVKGADWFVEGSAGIADRFGIPQLVIGLTIVAMGTSAPEAAVKHHRGPEGQRRHHHRQCSGQQHSQRAHHSGHHRLYHSRSRLPGPRSGQSCPI